MEACGQPAFRIHIPGCEVKTLFLIRSWLNPKMQNLGMLFIVKNPHTGGPAAQTHVARSQLHFLTSSLYTHAEKATDQLPNTKDGVGKNRT